MVLIQEIRNLAYSLKYITCHLSWCTSFTTDRFISKNSYIHQTNAEEAYWSTAWDACRSLLLCWTFHCIHVLLSNNMQLFAQGLQLENELGTPSLGTLTNWLFPTVKEIFSAIFLRICRTNCRELFKIFNILPLARILTLTTAIHCGQIWAFSWFFPRRGKLILFLINIKKHQARYFKTRTLNMLHSTFKLHITMIKLIQHKITLV
jgi:hypothetical protein